MGDLATDTAVKPNGEGQYQGKLSGDWEIWGPMGGYVAACALRAAGMSSTHPQPAAFSCHYLNVARFEPIDLKVTTLKRGRAAESQRVEITQGDRPILEAIVWSVAEAEGLEHDLTEPPDVPGPDEVPDIRDLVADEDRPPFPFWENFESRPLDFEPEWPPDGPRPPRWRSWLRFSPTPAYDDPWVDATRSVILADLPSWPAAHRQHAWQEPPFTAPTLDLNVAFHRPHTGDDWLLCEGSAPLSTNGLFAWTAGIWSPGGRLKTSGGGQCLYRRLSEG